MTNLIEIANEVNKNWDNSYNAEISEDEKTLYVSHKGDLVIEVSEKFEVTEIVKGHSDAKEQLEFYINA